jgi:hypothetical protein
MIVLAGTWLASSIGLFSDDVSNPFDGSSDGSFDGSFDGSSDGFGPFGGDPFEHSPFFYFAPILILAVLGFAVIIFFGRRAWKQDKERIRQLQEWTRQRDYSFAEEDPGLARIYPNLPLESGGRRLRFQHVVRGRLAGQPFTAFDYSYETTSTSTNSDGGSSSSTTTHRIQAIAVDVPSGWPAVRVSPSGLGSKLAVMFGRQDVKIGYDAFDRTFRVRAQDEAAARRLLTPMASALLARPDQEFWIDGSTVLALRRGFLQHADLETWLQQVKAILAQAPTQDR